jgi:hypothetical protein
VPNDVIRVDPERVAPSAAEALRPAVAEWERHGLRLAFYWTHAAEPLTDEELLAATLLSEDGKIAATTIYNRTRLGGFTHEQTFSGALSRMPDGVVLATTTRKRDYDDPPHRRVHYLTGRTIAEVAAHHRHRLSNIPLEPLPFTPSALLEFFRGEGRRQTRAFIDRGVLVPMTSEEVAAARRRLKRDDPEAATSQVAVREAVTSEIPAHEESGNPYQSPAAYAPSPEPAPGQPRPLAWPWATLWLMWPPVAALTWASSTGESPLSVFLLLIVLASNAGFVDSLYRRNQVRRPWLMALIWLTILIGQAVALCTALVVAGAV